MIRDKIKDEEYFYEYLSKKEKRFETMQNAMEQRKAMSDFAGENDKGIRNAYRVLSVEYMSYLVAQYSAGESIEKMRNAYDDLLLYSEKIWNEYCSYVDCIWFVAIGVLLGVNEAEKELLNSILLKYKKRDKLIAFFMKYLCEDKDDSLNYAMPKPYHLLNEYIEEGREDVGGIETYLANHWYRAHKDMAWYDSHKGKHNTYYGYWSFETAAIVKVLDLDDSSLKGKDYYPYDLVHYT